MIVYQLLRAVPQFTRLMRIESSVGVTLNQNRKNFRSLIRVLCWESLLIKEQFASVRIGDFGIGDFVNRIVAVALKSSH